MNGLTSCLLRTTTVVLVTGGAVNASVFDPDVYGSGVTMSDYMRPVAGGGQPGGPAYTFSTGMFEITNGQFAAFLNDAQLDGGATGKGSNMYFENNGSVRTAPSGPGLFAGGPQVVPSPILYDPSAPLGQRFSLRPINGMDMSPFPVTWVSWFGAVKFANWLTLDQGLGESERIYAEGPNAEDWHPVTINTADWQTRDLNPAERQALVDNYLGFRLPMDDQSATASAFNEFYKAAAWDPIAQVNRTYGFGRDTIDHRDANGAMLHPEWEYYADDPFEAGTDPDTTPVGFYDGTLWQRSDWNWPDPDPEFDTFQTRPNENAYGIFDLSGNVYELCQDQWSSDPSARSVRGGSWKDWSFDLVTDYRTLRGAVSVRDNLGFRLVQLPEPSTLIYGLASVGVLRRRRRG